MGGLNCCGDNSQNKKTDLCLTDYLETNIKDYARKNSNSKNTKTDLNKCLTNCLVV
jgi:hypothetical protein